MRMLRRASGRRYAHNGRVKANVNETDDGVVHTISKGDEHGGASKAGWNVTSREVIR